MKKLPIILFALLCSCADISKQVSEYDVAGYNAQLMHFDLQHEYIKLHSAFYSSDEATMLEVDAWLKHSLENIANTKNNQPYFNVCADAYYKLNKLNSSYKWAFVDSDSISQAERAVVSAISACSEFVKLRSY